MKLRAPVLAAVVLAVLAGGCNRTDRKKIAVIPKGRTHLFWQSIHAGAVKAGQEKNVEILWNAPTNETDFNGQLQIVDSMINRKVDAICLAPIDKKVMVSVVERAYSQKIPVVIFDSGIDTEHFVTQVATDNYHAGELGAERLNQVLNGKGNIIEVACQPGAASTMDRERGFEEAIQKKYTGLKILDKRYGWADFAKSLAISENMMNSHPEANGMFGSNETSAVGAAQALKARPAGSVKLVGFDWGKTIEEGIQSGQIDSAVVQHPFEMGYRSVMSAVEYLSGGNVPKIQNIPPLVVTKDNLNSAEVQERVHPDLDKYLK